MRTIPLVVSIGLLVGVTSLGAQSLADAAKAAADKRAATTTTATPKKVWTNADVGGAAAVPPLPALAPDGALATAGAAGAVENPSADVGPVVQDEGYWRGRMAPLVRQLVSDNNGAFEASRRLDLARSVRAVTATLTALGDLEHWNAVVRDDLRAIEALKEEGRRAEALPGWFR